MYVHSRHLTIIPAFQNRASPQDKILCCVVDVKKTETLSSIIFAKPFKRGPSVLSVFTKMLQTISWHCLFKLLALISFLFNWMNSFYKIFQKYFGPFSWLNFLFLKSFSIIFLNSRLGINATSKRNLLVNKYFYILERAQDM